MKVFMEHQVTGQIVEVKQGFAWSVLFFGSLALLVRGQIKEAILYAIFAIPTLGIYPIYMCFKANEKKEKKLMKNGFTYWRR